MKIKRIKRISGTVGVRITATERVLGFNKIAPIEVDMLLYKQENKINHWAPFYDVHFKGTNIYMEKGLSSFKIERRAMYTNIKLIFQGNLN